MLCALRRPRVVAPADPCLKLSWLSGTRVAGAGVGARAARVCAVRVCASPSVPRHASATQWRWRRPGRHRRRRRRVHAAQGVVIAVLRIREEGSGRICCLTGRLSEAVDTFMMLYVVLPRRPRSSAERSTKLGGCSPSVPVPTAHGRPASRAHTPVADVHTCLACLALSRGGHTSEPAGVALPTGLPKICLALTLGPRSTKHSCSGQRNVQEDACRCWSRKRSVGHHS